MMVGKMTAFTCTICGETMELPFHRSRRYCPKCAKKIDIENIGRYKRQRKEKDRKPTDELSARIDQRSQEEIRTLCVKCRWAHRPPGGRADYCDFCYLNSHSRARKDDGTCASFEPLPPKNRGRKK